jgi:hypothetical protein
MWNMISHNDHIESTPIFAQVQNPQSPSLLNSSKCWLLHPTMLQMSLPYQDHGEEVEEEDKRWSQTRRSSPKSKVKKMEEIDLEIYSSNFSTKPKISLELFC